jgi:hypothetical protein
VTPQGGGWTLSMNCPRLKVDLCMAWADLAHAFTDARQPAEASQMRESARKYGCQSAGN